MLQQEKTTQLIGTRPTVSDQRMENSLWPNVSFAGETNPVFPENFQSLWLLVIIAGEASMATEFANVLSWSLSENVLRFLGRACGYKFTSLISILQCWIVLSVSNDHIYSSTDIKCSLRASFLTERGVFQLLILCHGKALKISETERKLHPKTQVFLWPRQCFSCRIHQLFGIHSSNTSLNDENEELINYCASELLQKSNDLLP